LASSAFGAGLAQHLASQIGIIGVLGRLGIVAEEGAQQHGLEVGLGRLAVQMG
jgi:hypothetical protein